MEPRKPILITGGAGYIGSHVVLAFRDAGYPVVIIDNLSTGHRAAIPGDVVFVEGNVDDIDTVTNILAEHRIAAVVHLAASTSVPESVNDPLLFYRNNCGASTTLIRACVASGVGRFIFSSTAAVYGAPRNIPVAEDSPTVPINPYGTSKLITEWTLRDAAMAHDFRYIALRYFNVAGADPKGRAGQSGLHSEHLITVACKAAVGTRGHVTVFGTDYDTRDGTCVRDFIHVSDLADAHLAAIRHLESDGACRVFNCGYGRGFSVREVIEAVEAEAGMRLDIREGPRRAGDPPALVADVSRFRASTEWSPRYFDLAVIVRNALSWEKTLAKSRR